MIKQEIMQDVFHWRFVTSISKECLCYAGRYLNRDVYMTTDGKHHGFVKRVGRRHFRYSSAEELLDSFPRGVTL